MDISYEQLPHSAQESMRAYVEHGRPTGSFLKKILCNDLVGAVGQADDFNMHILYEYTKWLYNDAPKACWGNLQIVNLWIEHKGMEQYERLVKEEQNG